MKIKQEPTPFVVKRYPIIVRPKSFEHDFEILNSSMVAVVDDDVPLSISMDRAESTWFFSFKYLNRRESWNPTAETKTSPPRNMRVVMMRSWKLEKTSISMTDMLETETAETEVKKMLRSFGEEEFLVLVSFRAPKPKREMVMK